MKYPDFMNHTAEIPDDQEPQGSFHICWGDWYSGCSMDATIQKQDITEAVIPTSLLKDRVGRVNGSLDSYGQPLQFSLDHKLSKAVNDSYFFKE